MSPKPSPATGGELPGRRDGPLLKCLPVEEIERLQKVDAELATARDEVEQLRVQVGALQKQLEEVARRLLAESPTDACELPPGWEDQGGGHWYVCTSHQGERGAKSPADAWTQFTKRTGITRGEWARLHCLKLAFDEMKDWWEAATRERDELRALVSSTEEAGAEARAKLAKADGRVGVLMDRCDVLQRQDAREKIENSELRAELTEANETIRNQGAAVKALEAELNSANRLDAAAVIVDLRARAKVTIGKLDRARRTAVRCADERDTAAGNAAEAIRANNELGAEIAALRLQLRCNVTRNLCGTDTRPVGSPCECPACKAWESK